MGLIIDGVFDGLVDVVATPDHDTVRASWEDDVTAIAIADVTLDGEPFPYAARHVLRKAIAAWEELGYRPQIGIELEAYVLEPDADAPRSWRRLENPPRDVGRAILDAVPNTEGLYWVDFTVLDLFPPGPYDAPPPEEATAGDDGGEAQ